MTFDPDEVVSPKTSGSPEHRLWATCFIDGVRCALAARKNRLATKRDRRSPEWPPRVTSDEEWLYDERQQHMGSFNWLCELFDQDPNKVRNRVLMNHRELIKDAA